MNFKADSNQTNKCGHCGATENLMKCTKCSAAAYCSKKCQVSDWSTHKFICKVISKAESKANEMDAIGSIYKVAEKQGVIQVKMMMTHVGPVRSDDKEMPAGVPENFLFIHEGATKIAMLGGDKRMYGEREYKRLYDDLVSNEQEWIEVSVSNIISLNQLQFMVFWDFGQIIFAVQFFERFHNHNSAGDCAMVIEELAHVYYGRGDYESCGQVLDMHAKVLHCGKMHIARVGDDLYTQSFARAEYRANQIRFEMNLVLNNLSRNIPLFKELCQFEIMHKPSKEQHLCKSWRAMYKKCKSLDDLSDAMILKVIKEHSWAFKLFEVDSSHFQLRECGLCKKKETSLGEFMNCSRCKKVACCGRTCQKKHWKIHKSNCKAAPGGK